MERQSENQLDEIKSLVASMGGNAEKALEKAVTGLVNRDTSLFAKVHEIEKEINRDHMAIDEKCTQYLVKHGPVASDLRWVVSILKINMNLERMGDQAVNIAYCGADYLGRVPIVSTMAEIEKMTVLVRKMIKDSLDCVIRTDDALANQVLVNDDEVDKMKHSLFKSLVAFIKSNPDKTESAMDLILIARNLERLADHATNIAEDVIYVKTGKDIRHGGRFQ